MTKGHPEMLKTIISIAKEAGDRIMQFYDHPEVTLKADESPVTQADLEAHKIIVGRLSEAFPEIPVISEEAELPEYNLRRRWNRFWLVDPLDGTKEFIHKNGEFTVNIALIRDGKPVCGVVYAPAVPVLYAAEENHGAWKQYRNEEPVQIHSGPADVKAPLRIVSSRSHASEQLNEYLKQYNVSARLTAGSSIKFCMVAEGSADLYPRLGPTMEWDVAAGDCIFRYSGRQTVRHSDLQYNKPDLRNDSFVIGLK